MGQLLLLLVVALTVAAVVFGVTVLVTGGDPGLGPAEPDARSVPLPGNRPLQESDVADVRFDTALRGYRMTQVDQALRRAAYDIGYKDELIGVLEAEVTALREGRTAEAEELRRAREAALVPAGAAGAASAGAAGTDATAVANGRDPEAATGTAPQELTRASEVGAGTAVEGSPTPASPEPGIPTPGAPESGAPESGVTESASPASGVAASGAPEVTAADGAPVAEPVAQPEPARGRPSPEANVGEGAERA
ncbi:DivIVA domain-containing protein [Micromonospora sp. NPDC049559]|uniref:DivIVA domain-containing protein n=1 Tax=Micromonospora sp. NPDC049559 TaxID=3155923 RepID=UPI0034366188